MFHIHILTFDCKSVWAALNVQHTLSVYQGSRVRLYFVAHASKNCEFINNWYSCSCHVSFKQGETCICTLFFVYSHLHNVYVLLDAPKLCAGGQSWAHKCNHCVKSVWGPVNDFIQWTVNIIHTNKPMHKQTTVIQEILPNPFSSGCLILLKKRHFDPFSFWINC